MPKLFLSYRRSDRYAAGLLRAEVVRRLGSARIFMDARDLRAGDDFPTRTESAIIDAAAVLVLIGPGWVAELGRLQEPQDWVRRELKKAVDADARLVPILLDDAELPRADALPEPIRGLADAQAYRVHSDHLDRDVGDLLRSLGERRRRIPLIGALLAVILAVVAGTVVFWPSNDDRALTFLNTMLLFDGSSRMQVGIPTGESEPVPRSDVVASHVSRYVKTRSGDNLALRIAGSCGDPGETVVPFQTDAGDEILRSLASTSFTGDNFPLAAAIVAATADFNDPERFPVDAVSRQIIVFTTTGDTCQPDPGSILEERWEELGDIRLRVELIGLGIEKGTEEAGQLEQAAASVDGRAYPISSAEELDTLLRGLLEVEPVQLATQQVVSVGNSIVEPLSDLRGAFLACDFEAAENAVEEATARVVEADPALNALDGRDEFEAFTAVHESGVAWAENLSKAIPAGQKLAAQVKGVEDDEGCNAVHMSEQWRDVALEWDETVRQANAARTELGGANAALREELNSILGG